MAFIRPQRIWDGLEEVLPQTPSKTLWGILVGRVLTETDQNMATTNSAGVNYGYMPSPQGYRNAAQFNETLPVIPSAPTLPARTRRNRIEEL